MENVKIVMNVYIVYICLDERVVLLYDIDIVFWREKNVL